LNGSPDTVRGNAGRQHAARCDQLVAEHTVPAATPIERYGRMPPNAPYYGASGHNVQPGVMDRGRTAAVNARRMLQDPTRD